MKKWEYKEIDTIVPGSAGGFKERSELLSEINAAGEEGWRLMPNALSNDHRMCLMEREKKE